MSPQGTDHGPEFARVQQATGQCSQSYGILRGWSCVETGVGPAGFYGSLSTSEL